MKRPLFLAIAFLLAAPMARAQILDYAAAAGAAGLGTGLGAGASKVLGGATGRAMKLTSAQLKQVNAAVGQAMNSAAAKEKGGDHAGAVAQYLQAAQMRQRYFGQDDATAGQYFFRAGTEQAAAKNYSGAEGSLKSSLAICLRNHGAGSQQSIPILFNLAETMTALNRCGEAMNFYKQTLALQERNGDPARDVCNQTRMDLAAVCLRSGDYTTAESALKQAVDYVEAGGASQTKDHDKYVQVLTLYENALRENLKTADADQVAAKLSALSNNKPPAGATTSDAATAPANPQPSTNAPEQANPDTK